MSKTTDGMGNKVDYNKQMKEIPAEGSLLLHACCAPCSSSVLPRLKGFKIIPYFYNPNIDTVEEYNKRAEQFGKLGVVPQVEKYDHDEFITEVRGLEDLPEGGERCRKCIEMRLRRAAIKAKEEGAEWFCSTLSVSPHKDAEYINEVGKELESKYGVKFLPNDFKKENGFLESVRLSRDADLYRQNYCGCEFSRRDVEPKK